ncbi:substrate-binding periplasmic protein [Thalassotalea atypica]|uniref:substrate-binding periplasmic protein n=1 Tax=Thalassotalea atypica TaxID=2054316 RepID=UPI002572217C|nr:transporter substrate-binding domain-containing protein [Thalassotalea atypica]
MNYCANDTLIAQSKRAVCAILMLVVSVGHCTNIEHIDISSYYIPGLVESESKGVMIDMLRKLEQVQQIKFNLSLMPTVRVQKSFQTGAVYSYFPELEEFRPLPSCRTVSFMQKKIIAITRRGEPPILDASDLEGKRVGAVKGYSYGLAIINNENIALHRVNNDTVNLQKLFAGRIDVIIGDVHSTIAAIKQSKMVAQLEYDVDRPVALLDVFFVFPDHGYGKIHCEQVSKGIEILKEQGDLKRWFG